MAKPESSVAVNQTNVKYGDTVTFTVVHDFKNGDKDQAPKVGLNVIRQDGAVIWATAGFADRSYRLHPDSGSAASKPDGTPQWDGTFPVTCHVDLYHMANNGSITYLATTEFQVAAAP